MSFAGFCETCGLPYYEGDALLHQHKPDSSSSLPSHAPVEFEDGETENGTTTFELNTPAGRFYLETGRTKYSAHYKPVRGETQYFEGKMSGPSLPSEGTRAVRGSCKIHIGLHSETNNCVAWGRASQCVQPGAASTAEGPHCPKCNQPTKPMYGDEPPSEWEHTCAAEGPKPSPSPTEGRKKLKQSRPRSHS